MLRSSQALYDVVVADGDERRVVSSDNAVAWQYPHPLRGPSLDDIHYGDGVILHRESYSYTRE